MRGVRRVLLVLIVLVIAFGVLAFVLENQQGVALSFMGWTTTQIPVSVFMALSLLIGLLVSPALGLLVGRNKTKRAE